MLLIVGAQAAGMCRSLIFDVSSLSTQSQPPVIFHDTLGRSIWEPIQVMNRQGKPCFCNGGGAETSDLRAGVVMDPSVRGWLCSRSGPWIA